MYKRVLIETLLQRSFRLCSNYENCYQEFEILKSVFKHNSYPQNFVNQSINTFLNKLCIIKRDLNFMVPKKESTFVLPYLGNNSLDLRTRLRRTIERGLPYCKLKLIFRSNCRLNTLLRFKDSFAGIYPRNFDVRYVAQKTQSSD